MNTRYIVAAIIQKGDQIIIGKKPKGQPPYPDVWQIPGGGVEDKQKAIELISVELYDDIYFHNELKREVREELGIEIANIHCIVPQYRSKPREGETKNKHGELTHYVFLEYLCDYVNGKIKAADDLAEAKWIAKSELKNISVTPPSAEMYRELGWI